MSDVTYSYCIENLRYIHKIIGIDSLIKEAMFIDHLSKSNIESISVEHVRVEPVNEKVELVELDVDPNIPKTIAEIVPENRNVVINPQKYTRTVLNDECKCECIINNGQRCTLKKSKDSKYCSRHKTKMS